MTYIGQTDTQDRRRYVHHRVDTQLQCSLLSVKQTDRIATGSCSTGWPVPLCPCAGSAAGERTGSGGSSDDSEGDGEWAVSVCPSERGCAGLLESAWPWESFGTGPTSSATGAYKISHHQVLTTCTQSTHTHTHTGSHRHRQTQAHSTQHTIPLVLRLSSCCHWHCCCWQTSPSGGSAPATGINTVFPFNKERINYSTYTETSSCSFSLSLLFVSLK